MPYSRFAVVGTHFLISAIVLGGLLLVMLLWWYPNGLFQVAGGWQGIRILAPIDLVLGPLLTLMFYRPFKKGVVRDLAVIACVQVAALGYGLKAVYEQRPVVLVFAEGEFIAVTPPDRDDANAALLAKSYQPIDPAQLSSARPAVVVAKPVPREEYASYVMSLFNDMPELAMRADRYEPLSAHSDLLVTARVEAPEPDQRESAAWFRLNSKFGKGLVKIDLTEGQLVASASEPTLQLPQTQALQGSQSKGDSGHNP
ncbi:MAG: hypothetical protein AAF499_08825 [Pseudomonadota bacterium]